MAIADHPIICEGSSHRRPAFRLPMAMFLSLAHNFWGEGEEEGKGKGGRERGKDSVPSYPFRSPD